MCVYDHCFPLALFFLTLHLIACWHHILQIAAIDAEPYGDLHGQHRRNTR
jgi:hypothetical protein